MPVLEFSALRRRGQQKQQMIGASAVSATWAVQDSNGQLLPDIVAGSRLDVGRKIVPTRYDAFRLHVSASYREMFDRELRKVLEANKWQILRVKAQRRRRMSGNVICMAPPALRAAA
jgi:hypothetical protein